MNGVRKSKREGKDFGQSSSNGLSKSSVGRGVRPRPSNRGTAIKSTRNTTSSRLNLNRRMSGMRLTDDRSSTRSRGSQPSRKPADKNKEIHYSANSIIGKGSFGVVYKATVTNTGEVVAIKKVLQDRRFKNRELSIMKMMHHPNVVELKHSFYAKGDKDDVYLNLVMEYVPHTLHHQLKNFVQKMKKSMPMQLVKLYMYQISRALAYIHSLGICHRDIKPHNLLMDPRSHVCKLIDFGSAKILVAGQANVAYICSRYYRAPELVFEATEYTTAIDVWSMGCVMAELLLGKPIFMGQSREHQLIEIVKILGTPTRAEIKQMNPNHKMHKFARIKGHPWTSIFPGKSSVDAIDLISQFLQYVPAKRTTAFKALAHPFFDDLRNKDMRLPDGRPPPPLFNFTETEMKQAAALKLHDKLQPRSSKN